MFLKIKTDCCCVNKNWKIKTIKKNKNKNAYMYLYVIKQVLK